MIVGDNVHYASTGDRLCSYSKKVCFQRPMEGHAFCIRHILEDPTAPYTRCQHMSTSTGRPCSNAVPLGVDSKFCGSHRAHVAKKKRGSAGGANETPDAKAIRERNKNVSTRHTRQRLKEVLREQNIHRYENEDYGSSSGDFARYPSSGASDTSTEEEDNLEYLDPSMQEKVLDGLLQDVDYLSGAATPGELAALRAQRIDELARLYKEQFVRLRSVLRSKHRHNRREYRKLVLSMSKGGKSKAGKGSKKGKKRASSTKASSASKAASSLQNYHKDQGGEPPAKRQKTNTGKKASNAPGVSTTTSSGVGSASKATRCAYSGCEGQGALSTSYCFEHILHDPNQRMFKQCGYASVEGIQCQRPTRVADELCDRHSTPVTIVGSNKKRKRDDSASVGVSGVHAAAAAVAPPPQPTQTQTQTQPTPTQQATQPR